MSKLTMKELQEQLLTLTSQVADLTNRLADNQSKTPVIELPEGELPPAIRYSKKGQPRPNVHYELLGVPGEGVKLQPQAKKVCIVLSRAADPKHITEKEAMQLVKTERTRAYFATCQDPWRIFQYYMGKLIEKNFLRQHVD